MAGPDYIVDIEGVASPRNPRNSRKQGGHGVEGQGAPNRPWLAVTWRCCSVYSRVYRNRAATAYVGACPKCGKAVNVPIGPGGTSNRFFQAR